MQNKDLKEILSKVKKIQCMHCPRYSVYDKVSKTRIYLDSIIGVGSNINHVAWNANNKAGCLGVFKPQMEFKDGVKFKDFDEYFKPLEEALDMALTVAREGRLEEFKLIPAKYGYGVVKA